jgi:membrane fusion protein (multidrug efflux system)
MSNTHTKAATAPESPAAPPKKKRGPVFWAAVTVAAGAGGVWLASFIHRSIVYTETDDAYVSGHVHMISSRLDGSVTGVLVQENETVKAGQVLARLDPFASQVALDKARAALDSARADSLQAQAALNQAKAQEAQARAQVAEARAQVGRSSAQLDLANVNSGRSEKLFHADTRTISQSEVDATLSAKEASESALTAMKAGLEAAEARVRVDSAAIESSAALVASADAREKAEQESVLDAERNLTYATITAPADGRIGNKNVEVGNRVQVGQPLFALVEPNYWVTANFKETQLRGMEAGQRVEVTIDAIGHVFTGRLDSVAPATSAQFALLPADNATGNFTKVVQRVPVKVIFDKDSIQGFEDRLRPGLSAVVSVKVR